MPKFQVLIPCFIDGHLRQVGEVITTDAKPGKALLALDAPAPEALPKEKAPEALPKEKAPEAPPKKKAKAEPMPEAPTEPPREATAPETLLDPAPEA